MDITTQAHAPSQSTTRVALGPAIAPRSLAEVTRNALLSAREFHELLVDRYHHRVEDGFHSEQAVAAAKFDVEQSAALVEELLYQVQIVEQLHPSIRDHKHPLKAVVR